MVATDGGFVDSSSGTGRRRQREKNHEDTQTILTRTTMLSVSDGTLYHKHLQLQFLIDVFDSPNGVTRTVPLRGDRQCKFYSELGNVRTVPLAPLSGRGPARCPVQRKHLSISYY
jgi:hypothetical protein